MRLQSYEEPITFYRRQIEEELWPFWAARGMDTVNGGVFTCFSNDGSRLASTDKYTWSQGRFLWLVARMARLSGDGMLRLDSRLLVEQADRTAAFLRRCVFLDDGSCAALLTTDGERKETESGAGFSTSIYADCFVALGFCEYARLARDRGVLEIALEVYRSITVRVAEGAAPTEPYPTPTGFKTHGIPMILLNVAWELALALADFGDTDADRMWLDVRSYMRQILYDFRGGDDLIREMAPLSREPETPYDDLLLCRHVAPGHSLESMWLVLRAADALRDAEAIDLAARVIKRSFTLGWDSKYGGLLRFVDAGGGEPRGKSLGTPYEDHVTATWDMKLWWVHSEALYSARLAYVMTSDETFERWYQTVRDYAFGTFPNPDRAVGEWIQKRDRAGQPSDVLVSFPVKDPYHILRNLILMVELLGRQPVFK